VYDENGDIKDFTIKMTDEELKKEYKFVDVWEESISEVDDGMSQFAHVPKEILKQEDEEEVEEEEKYAGDMTKETWDKISNKWNELCAMENSTTYGSMPQNSVWWNTFVADCETYMPTTQEQMDGMRVETARFLEVIRLSCHDCRCRYCCRYYYCYCCYCFDHYYCCCYSDM
jgi:hypothetical protein